MNKLHSKISRLVPIVLFCMAMTSCNKKEDNKFETVLKIGDVEMTKNQYIKSKNSYVSSHKIDTFTEAKLQEFNQSVIDDYYLLADAYRKRFHS